MASGMPGRLSAIQAIASRIDDLIVHETAPFASEVALGRVHTQAHIDLIVEIDPADETAPFASEVALGRVHTQAHIDYIRGA